MWDAGAREEVHKSLRQLISISQAKCCTPGEVCVPVGGEGFSIVSSSTFQCCQPALGAPAKQGNLTVCLLCAGIKRFRVEKFGQY